VGMSFLASRVLESSSGRAGTRGYDSWIESDPGQVLRSGWIARPPIGRNTRGATVTPCSEVLDDEIAYFDTEFIEPDATANPAPAVDG